LNKEDRQWVNDTIIGLIQRYNRINLAEHIQKDHDLIPFDCPIDAKVTVGFKKGSPMFIPAGTTQISFEVGKSLQDGYYSANYVECLTCHHRFKLTSTRNVWDEIK